MKTVFLLTSGEYSDYTVHMAFPTRELADQACEVANSSRGYASFGVEEYPLLEEVPKLVTVYNMSEMQGAWTFDMWEHEASTTCYGEDAYIFPGRRPLVVRGLDEERVKKVYSDTLAARREGRSV